MLGVGVERWEDFAGNTQDILRRGRHTNLSLKTTHITQKEKDIQNLAFTNWTDDILLFFYTYDSSPIGEIYYKVFSISDNRVLGSEKRITGEGDDEDDLIYRRQPITGMYALNAETDGVFLAIAYPDRVNIHKITDLDDLTRDLTFSKTGLRDLVVPNVSRFRLYQDQIEYYVGESSALQIDKYNPSASIKTTRTSATAPPFTAPPLIRADDPAEIGGRMLNDFYNWGDRERTETFEIRIRLLWSIQTGYFLVNQDERIIGHIYGNFTPFNPGNPFRMDYQGQEIVLPSGKVYVPILRSGQVEVVNRTAITDRIIDDGRGRSGADLVAFRPLGLDLLTIDYFTDNIPQLAQIGKEKVLSGALLSWTDGQTLSEYQFTERPSIKKSMEVDYDKWPYSDLDVNLPSVQDIEPDQYHEARIPFQGLTSPYLVEAVAFTAGANGSFSRWNSGSTTAKRTTRYATNAESGDAQLGGPVISQVRYDATNQAVVANFTGYSTIVGRDYPQSIIVNGLRYVFNHFIRSGGNLTCYCIGITTNPFASGLSYSVAIPKGEIIKSTGNNDIQPATEGNNNTNILLNELKLLRLKNITLGETGQVAENLNNARVRFGTFNHYPDIGALTDGEDIRGTVGVRVNVKPRRFSGLFKSGSGHTLNPGISGSSSGGIAVTGNTLWYITYRKTTISDASFRGTATAFNISTGRATGRTIALGHGVFNGATIIGSRLYVLDTLNNQIKYYNLSSGSRLGSINIPERVNGRIAGWNTLVSDGTTLWIIGSYGGYAYRVSNGGRNSTRDLPNASGYSYGSAYANILDQKLVWAFNSRGLQRVYDVSGSGRPSIVNNRNITLFPGEGVSISGASQSNGVLYVFNTNPDTNLRGYNLTEEVDNPITYGAISNARVTGTTIDLAGLWTTGKREERTGKLYMLFRGRQADYASSSDINTALENLLESITFSVGSAEYVLNFSRLRSRRGYTSGSNTYARYEVSVFPNNSNLRDNIIFASSILTSSNLSIQFRKKEQIGFLEAEEVIEPVVLSGIYTTRDQLGNPKNYSTPGSANEAINNSLIFFDNTDRNKNMSVYFSDESFVNLRLRGTNVYYQATRDNPLRVNAEVFNFEAPKPELIVRYPFVAVQPVVDTESLLSAEVYNYKCCFKWVDDNGIEHRSQFSDVIQLVTNTPMGEPGNRPTFDIKNINLTNKPDRSISIEIYRTKNKSQTFQAC